MNNTPVCVPFVYSDKTEMAAVNAVVELAEQSELPLSFESIVVEQKLTQKVRKQLSDSHAQPILIMDEKQAFTLVTNQISVSPEWKSLQRRVVSAGRKSELVLQASKLNDNSRALDATAGFGHDSLILASTGAQVTLLERNPLMALLLLHEQQMMAQQKNWQKLMARLTIVCADSAEYMAQFNDQADGTAHTGYDVVYLDPMFPENSYDHASTSKGAKVGKHMQALHQIALPPDIEEERRLLALALDTVNAGGRVVVKRPNAAPLFAERPSDENWQNDVVRFDGYFSL